MAKKNTTLDYTFGTIRRQVTDIYPDLLLHFIIHGPEADQAKAKQKIKLPEHPAAEIAQEHLLRNTSRRTHFTGIAVSSGKALPFFKKKNSFLALCHINLEEETLKRTEIFPDNPDQYDRAMAYSLVWKVLDLFEKYKHNKNDEYTIENNIIRPTGKRTEALRANLLSECFATMLMEQQGETGTIRQFMKQRCKRSIHKIKHSTPENHPFPIAFDSTRIIFKDLRNLDPKSPHLIKHTLSMTEEIGNTCDDITLQQWSIFCYAAQEMAWMDRSKHEILSAATYSSDDAHMRTTAYIIAEALNTNVTPLNNPQFYSPFADQEKYERLHHKTAAALFEELIEVVDTEERPEILLQQALLQNKMLFEGQIIGWCSPALVKTCNAYSKRDERTKKLLQEIFYSVLDDTKWSNICELNRFIMLKKRKETPLTSDLILKEYIADRQERALFAEAFSAL